MIYFDHPYPRYGLASALYHADIRSVTPETIPEEMELAKLAANFISDALYKYRLHTDDKPLDNADTDLRFRYLKAYDLSTKKVAGQRSENLYYIAPHIVIDDISANNLIKEAQKMVVKLAKAKELSKNEELKRSFSPFTTKINAGTKSLSNPKTSLLQAAFTMVATLTHYKPAAQLDFKNQVIIPDLPLNDLLLFIDLFDKMGSMETDNLFVRELKAGKKNYRPPLFNGNYPNAPNTPVFGPVGLAGAMGVWAKKAKVLDQLGEVLEKLVKNPIYLVSYEATLFKQIHLGHHIARLAKEQNLPKAINGLYYADFYNPEHNKLDNPTRLLFLDMASRFLQLYSKSAFKDFLAFRLQYPHSFSPILEDYFMNERNISKEIIQSVRIYGSYLNYVAYIIGKNEAENKETGKDLYEAKARVLAQLESTAMSCKSPTALFAQLNVQAGRMSNKDVPEEASAFMEATNSGKISLETAQQLILAYMRLRSEKSTETEDTPSTAEGETFTTN
ncbi:MAG: hypothetical protein ABJI33_12270 [Balneola sp.]